VDIAEQTVLITGSTDGVGKVVARRLAEGGARVLLHGRNRDKGEAVMREIRERTGADSIEFYLADLGVAGRCASFGGSCHRQARLAPRPDQ
jgi:NAD(P)-dependent dehydrogenase (short-subunit alcohol dehydrogenase family)